MTPRLLAAIRLVPAAPAFVSTTTLVGELLALGYTVTARTVQRDLVALAKAGHVVAQADAKPFGWSAGAAPPPTCPTCGHGLPLTPDLGESA